MFNSNFLTLDARIRDGFRERIPNRTFANINGGRKLQNFYCGARDHCRVGEVMLD